MKRIKRQAPRRRQLLLGATAALALFGAAAEAIGGGQFGGGQGRNYRPPSTLDGRPSTPKILATVCGLFAPDLSYTFGDILNGSRDRLCAGIRAALARRDLKLRYDEPTIYEIFLSRATWRWCGSPGLLTAEKNGVHDATKEEGMDVFRRAPDGLWSIARYIAFPRRPNAVLDGGAPP